MEHRWSAGGAQVERRWSTGRAQVERRWSAGGAQVERRWSAGGAQEERRRSPGGAQAERRWSAGGNQSVEASALVSIGRDQDALDGPVLLSNSALGIFRCTVSLLRWPDQHKGCVIVQWTPDSQYRRLWLHLPSPVGTMAQDVRPL